MMARARMPTLLRVIGPERSLIRRLDGCETLPRALGKDEALGSASFDQVSRQKTLSDFSYVTLHCGHWPPGLMYRRSIGLRGGAPS